MSRSDATALLAMALIVAATALSILYVGTSR